MSDFTKGQWNLDTQDGCIRVDGSPIVQVFGATVHNNEATADKCFANARLILNAPVMYIILMYIVEELQTKRSEDINFSAVEKICDKILARIDGKEAAHED